MDKICIFTIFAFRVCQDNYSVRSYVKLSFPKTGRSKLWSRNQI